MELDLNYTPSKGVSFSCDGCPVKIQKLRRCREDRWDFTEKDDPTLFPMYVSKGGPLFGFCPGKATWDKDNLSLYRALKLSSESGTQWIDGGIADQPEWWIELLAWFLPRYNDTRFHGRVKGLLGGADPAQLARNFAGTSGTSGTRGQARGGNKR